MEVNLETRSLDPSKISFQPFNPLESRCLGGSENTYVGSNFFTIFFFLTSLHTSFSQKIPRRDFVRIPSPPPLLLQNWFTRDFHEARRRQLSTRSDEQPEINVFASAEKSPLFGGEGFGEHVIENAEIYRIFAFFLEEQLVERFVARNFGNNLTQILNLVKNIDSWHVNNTRKKDLILENCMQYGGLEKERKRKKFFKSI